MDMLCGVGLILMAASGCIGTSVSYSVPGSSDDHDVISVDMAQDNDQAKDILTPGNYPYIAQLDGNFNLQWKFNATHILFHSHVKANGYIVFGISDNGAMFPSDVIVAWVKDGQVHFSDRHASGQFLPVVDNQQDWHLLNGTEQGDYTTITMIRRLDTCDDEDFPIKNGTTRLIYGYSSTDPVSEFDIDYNSNTQGTVSILLLDPPPDETPLPEDTLTFDILATNYVVPDGTTYFCKVWKYPLQEEEGKHHIIKYEPVLQKGHEKLIHHIAVYMCPREFDDTLSGTQHNCRSNAPADLNKCTHTLFGWSYGGTAFRFPENTGISMGTPDDPIYLRMEIHYNNFDKTHGIVDNSGMRMYLTKQVRQYDTAMFETGIHVDSYLIVPPFMPSVMLRGYCHAGCIAEAVGDDEIYVFANHVHAHELGKVIRTRIIRDGVELPPILEEYNYDYAFQQRRILKEHRVVKKGDTLITDCYYDTSKKTTATFGGLGSNTEMCFSSLLYYPRKALTHCVTRYDYNFLKQVPPRRLYATLHKMDWTKKEVREDFLKDAETSDILNGCFGRTHLFHFHFTRTQQPNITVPYIVPDYCKN